MKYPYHVRLEQYEDGTAEWVARSESLKHCIGVGDTLEAAVKELSENEAVWLETAEEEDFVIPPVPKARPLKRTMQSTPIVQPA